MQKKVNQPATNKRVYTLPAAQQEFEDKAVRVVEAYAQSGNVKFGTIREILDFVQKDFKDPCITKLQFSQRYISRFISTHNFRKKRPSNQVPKTEEEINFERWRLNQLLLKYKPSNIINCDETGCNYNQRSSSNEKLFQTANSDGRSKDENAKDCTTIMPYLTAVRNLGFPPLVMSSK